MENAKTNSCFENFNKVIVEKSESDNYSEAIKEWEVIGCVIDSSISSKCLCGHSGIKYLYRIRNIFNGNELFPIGIKCIEKFGNKDMDKEASYMIKELELYKVLLEQRNYSIESLSGILTKDLAKHFYNKEVYVGANCSSLNGHRGYALLLKVLSSRDTKDISESDLNRFYVIVKHSILPYLSNKYNNKIMIEGKEPQ